MVLFLRVGVDGDSQVGPFLIEHAPDLELGSRKQAIVLPPGERQELVGVAASIRRPFCCSAQLLVSEAAHSFQEAEAPYPFFDRAHHHRFVDERKHD